MRVGWKKLSWRAWKMAKTKMKVRIYVEILVLTVGQIYKNWKINIAPQNSKTIIKYLISEMMIKKCLPYDWKTAAEEELKNSFLVKWMDRVKFPFRIIINNKVRQQSTPPWQGVKVQWQKWWVNVTT